MPALPGMKTTTNKNVRLKGAGIPSGLHMGLGLFPVVVLRLPPANGFDPIRGRDDAK
jgi:hypothetical protein